MRIIPPFSYVMVEMESQSKTKHSYDATVTGVMGWAAAEYFHIGELSGMHDKDLQYSYALSTANSMAHLNDAMLELIEDPRYARDHPDLKKEHGNVVRALKGLMKRYKIDVATIRQFNTRHVLRDRGLTYLKK